MTDWQQKALELFPDLQPDIEEEGANIYTLFFELLPRCEAAHVAGDTSELQKMVVSQIKLLGRLSSWSPKPSLATTAAALI